MSFWVLVFILLFLFGILSFLYKIKLGKREKNSKDNIQVNEALKSFKSSFASQKDKIVLIKEIDLVENFNRFPFKSDFKEIKNKYKNEKLILTIENTQKSFYDYWAVKEFDFFVIFENLSKKNFIVFSTKVLLLIYSEFLTKTFNLYKQTFILAVIPAIIFKEENKSFKSIKPENLNEYIDSQFLEFSKQLNKIIEMIEIQLQVKSKEKSKTNFEVDEKQLKLVEAYKILEVLPTDSDDKIRKAYLKLAKMYHPDKNNNEYAKEKMAQINDAYDIVVKERNKN
ncbi:J domain-containing protein [Spiroplasma endosymbiont of Cantharis lateralis]|uniref:J domain-containing protein n=1 Tax=Spiroplasma endosymbiont of Cantharis lateralis TaxID=3066277 RepID=UPI00313B65F8